MENYHCLSPIFPPKQRVSEKQRHPLPSLVPQEQDITVSRHQAPAPRKKERKLRPRGGETEGGTKNEPPHEKTNNMNMQKQRRRSASQ